MSGTLSPFIAYPFPSRIPENSAILLHEASPDKSISFIKIYFPVPSGAGSAAVLLTAPPSTSGSVCSSVSSSLSDSDSLSVVDSLSDSVSLSVVDSLSDSVSLSVVDSLSDSVSLSVVDSLSDSVSLSVSFSSVSGVSGFTVSPVTSFFSSAAVVIAVYPSGTCV